MIASVKKRGRGLLCLSALASAPVRMFPFDPRFGVSLFLAYPWFSCFSSSSPVPSYLKVVDVGQSFLCPASESQVRTVAVCVRSASERRLGVVSAGVGGFDVAADPGSEPIRGMVWVGGVQWWNPYALRMGHPPCARLPERALVRSALKQKNASIVHV